MNADAQDLDVTAEAPDRGQRVRLIRTTRTAPPRLSQAEFAGQFRVPVGTLRDWEQARVSPPDFAVAYVKVIGKFPEMVAGWWREGRIWAVRRPTAKRTWRAFVTLSADFDFIGLPVNNAHAVMAGEFRLVHNGPFDRVLAAQAIIEDFLCSSRMSGRWKGWARRFGQ